MISKIQTEEISDFKAGDNMSLNATPSSERLHLSFFGMRNAGKSSLVNAVTNQDTSLVSEIKGTTTDPVKKTMEILPLGPVVITDTPGIDDEGYLGEKRVQRAKEIIDSTDFAVLVVDAGIGLSNHDNELISLFKEKSLPFIIAYNKCDNSHKIKIHTDHEILVSAKEHQNINELRELIAKIYASCNKKEKPILDDIIKKGDLIILVTPIDASAPKGRLILPQQLILRNIIDNNCMAVVCKETELDKTLKLLSVKPDLVITDSQVFGYVNGVLSKDIKLTSFSIIMARYKGELSALIEGALILNSLKDGDKILISEGCTHHRQCNDIGTVKMPNWIKEFTGKDLLFDFSSGETFPENVSDYSLVVHCGGCMLNAKSMESRLSRCKGSEVPVVNYGVAIAMMHGILKRSLEIFPLVLKIIDNCEKNNV